MSTYRNRYKKILSVDEKISFLMEMPFECKIKKQGAEIKIVSAKSGIIASAADISECYKSFEEKKKNYFSQLIEMEEEDLIPFPDSRKRSLSDLPLFYLPLRDIGMIVAVFISALVISVSMTGQTKKILNRFDTYLLGDQPLPADKVKRFEEKIERVSPFLEAVRKGWEKADPEK